MAHLADERCAKSVTQRRRFGLRAAAVVVLPGVLVAATGVGAGDLNTAGLAGRELGLAVLWACALGAMLKFVVTEGLTRWQLATGETLLSGAIRRMGWWVAGPFAMYAGLWSVIVGAALVSACGTTVEAMIRVVVPSFGDGSATIRFWIGMGHAVIAAGLVTVGGFKTFERVMAALVGLMFLSVVVSVILIGPDWWAVVRGLAVPSVPASTTTADAAGGFTPLSRTVALIGGVGGTLTVLAYGYWIREHGRTGLATLKTCRLDMGIGYACTALFGMGILIIGATVGARTGSGNLLEQLSNVLGDVVGEPLRWVFLLGAWCAVFSSVLGVWQCVPMIWCDWLGAVRTGATRATDSGSERVPPTHTGHNAFRADSPRAYLAAVWLLAAAPMLVGAIDFEIIQLTYGVVGACFLPILAFGLLVMNGRVSWVGASRNRIWSQLALVATIMFFVWYGIDQF